MPRGGGRVESAVQAAAREALEEVGIDLGDGVLIGTRNMNRPHDVRTATVDLPDYGIKKGDIFMVSTQAVRFDVPDLKATKLNAGDDAMPGSARRIRIKELTREGMDIEDHYDMIIAATKNARPNALGFSGKTTLEALHSNGANTMTDLNFIQLTDPRSVPSDKSGKAHNVFLTGYSAAPKGYAEPTQAYVAGLVDTLSQQGKKVTIVTSPTASGQSIDAIGTVVAHEKKAGLLYITGKAYLEYVKPDELPAQADKDAFVKAPKYFFEKNDDYSLASAVVADVIVVTGGRDTAVLDFMNAVKEGKHAIVLNNPDLPTGFDEAKKRPHNAAEYISSMISAVSDGKPLPYPAVKGFDEAYIKANLSKFAQLVSLDNVKSPQYLKASPIVSVRSSGIRGAVRRFFGYDKK